MAKEIITTHLVYFVKCEKPLLFRDYIFRQKDTGQKRLAIPSKVIPLLKQKDIVPVFLTGNTNTDAAKFATMRERTGALAGIIQDLKDMNARMLIFGEEHTIRLWEKLFLKSGVLIHRYEVHNFFVQCVSPKKICYISSEGVVPIDDLICVN